MATPPSANQGIPMPDDDEHLKDVPDFVRTMGQAIEKQLVMRFDSVADRTARVGTPEVGMLAWMEDTARFVAYTGSSWQVIWPPSPGVTSGSAAPTGSGTLNDLYIQY